MRAFVTGGAGFVGRRLGPRLESEGYDVVSVDQEVDITDPEALAGAMAAASPDVVAHLAAQSSVARSWQDPASCFRVNYLGTLHVLRAMQQHCPTARLLFVSSGDTYGSRSPGSAPCREFEPLSPRSPYAQSKAAAERLACSAAEQGLDVVCTRSFNHTGAGQSDDFVASSFARRLADMEKGQAEEVLPVGNLDSVRDFLDVDDVIDAYVQLLRRETPAGVYNVASGRPVRIREILDLLLELSPAEPEVKVDPTRVRPSDYLVGDPSLLVRTTGWKPRTPLKRTLGKLLDAWRH
ncbi:MAG: GDP-mannose 4,6-dehydratase [Myxococcota bacterium]